MHDRLHSPALFPNCTHAVSGASPTATTQLAGEEHEHAGVEVPSKDLLAREIQDDLHHIIAIRNMQRDR